MGKNKETGDSMPAAMPAAGQREPQQQLNEKDLLAKQLNDYKDSLQRLQAEFENYKKRVEKEKAQFRQFAAAEVVRGFLPVLDSFELALKSIANGSNSGKILTAAANPALAGLHSRKSDEVRLRIPPLAELRLPPTCADDKIARGLELIYGQFYSALENLGLKPIKAVGEKLDPFRHEVLMQEETADEKKDGMVVEEFQKGYALNDVILRYSKVKVLKFAKANGVEK